MGKGYLLMIFEVEIYSFMRIKVFFNIYFNRLDIFSSIIKFYFMVFIRKFLVKNYNLVIFLVKVIVIIVKILNYC